MSVSATRYVRMYVNIISVHLIAPAPRKLDAFAERSTLCQKVHIVEHNVTSSETAAVYYNTTRDGVVHTRRSSPLHSHRRFRSRKLRLCGLSKACLMYLWCWGAVLWCCVVCYVRLSEHVSTKYSSSQFTILVLYRRR